MGPFASSIFIGKTHRFRDSFLVGRCHRRAANSIVGATGHGPRRERGARKCEGQSRRPPHLGGGLASWALHLLDLSRGCASCTSIGKGGTYPPKTSQSVPDRRARPKEGRRSDWEIPISREVASIPVGELAATKSNGTGNGAEKDISAEKGIIETARNY